MNAMRRCGGAGLLLCIIGAGACDERQNERYEQIGCSRLQMLVHDVQVVELTISVEPFGRGVALDNSL